MPDIVPRDGDFLVWYGYNEDPDVLTSGPDGRYGDASSFDWVYTEEGMRCCLTTYSGDVAEAHTVGQKRREVLVDARLGTDCLELVFGPPADLDGLQNFYAVCSTLPLVATSYDKAARQLTLTCRKTVLTSGEIAVYEDPEVQANYEAWIANRNLPTSFPAGVLPGSNLFVEQAEVRADGEDTLVVLTLAENAVSYNITEDQLLWNESRPWLRLSLQAASP